MITRRTFAGAAALAAAGALASCTGDGDRRGDADVLLVDDAPGSTVLAGTDLPATAAALSAMLFESATTVVIATEESAADLAEVSSRARLPLLIGTNRSVIDEIERLGAGTALTAEGTELGDLGEDLEVVELGPEGAEIPELSVDEQPVAVTLLVDPAAELPSRPVAAALVAAAGGTVLEVPDGDLGRSGDSVAAMKEAVGADPSAGVLALGSSFGEPDAFADALGRVTAMTELPGGGTTAFPGRRMIAAYGSPNVPSLGILGEQGLEETLVRVQEMAREYDGLAEEPIVPALEIITTIASSDPGGDGDYSSELSVDDLREWVDAAGEAGVYVVLDLQPGTTDFLTQARRYEELLTAPHVGLALDAEWRLEPGQKHLAQIGSVTAAEVNEVSTWLADLTAEHGLPQKVLILHQFNLSMISDRQDVDTSRPELAITLHADGHGTPEDKLATWNALQQDLPEGIHMAWKNFIDEDSPMFTPEETYDLEPRPWFVSYQ